VYLEIISNKAVFRGESTLRTWLFGVIRNVALRLQRTQNSAELLREKMKFLMGENECGDEVLQAQERNRLSHEVIQAISSLPTMQRQVVELVYYREFTLAEAAEVLGISIGSARTHFHRAKQALSGLLQHTRN
ncbi:MAG: RNA polymerase sigma factor, partial [Gammaproteobacteria bacterium]|nr:RNA polymerase sigma factor [Gammaproteobacteria bacterium]